MMDAPRKSMPGAERSIEIAIASSAEDLEALEADWNELYERSGRENPFLSYAWTRGCWEADADGCRPFIVTARINGKLVGLAAMSLERVCGLRVLRFLAQDRSDYLGFLSDPGARSVESKLLAEIWACRESWDLAVFRNLAESFTELHQSVCPEGCAKHVRAWATASYCRSEQDWDSLHASGPRWLAKMRKDARRYARSGGSARRFTGAEAADRLDIVADIEMRSWKRREGITRLQPGGGQQLLRSAFEAMGDEIELWIGYLDERPVAFQINFVTLDRLLLYQGSFDEAYRKAGPGSHLDYLAIEHAWKRGIREYDYLGGEEPYKLGRTSELRIIHHLAVHPRTALGWAAYGLLLAPRWNLRQIPVTKMLYKKLKHFTRVPWEHKRGFRELRKIWKAGVTLGGRER